MDIKTGDDIQIDVIGFQRIRQITLCSGRIVCQDDITVANGIFSGCFQTVTGKRIRIFGEFNSIGKVIDIEIPVIAVYIFANFIFFLNNSDYLQKARKYGHFTGYKN